MAREVVWSHRALEDRKRILRYWVSRNKSNTYSRKLNRLIKAAIKLIAERPHIGRPTDLPNVRVKIVRDYLIIYEVMESKLHIHSIWEGRQDPKKIGLPR
ncbi:MAG: type II toxin-antitoxin system RelE/ParE family toxin [Cyclobacteriaceae bacterium]|nr:type II toxin-antitoxin system RelE/ParE family toxin [Cyclobacteriaceae bacterium]